MRIGIPESLLFYRYGPAIRSFFEHLGMDVVYSGPSNRGILERGLRYCVDEACLPMKVFHGHVAKLQEDCDKVVVPRIMKCEYGESICPKFCGLPEMIKSSMKTDMVFTRPLYLNDRNKIIKSLIKDGLELGLPPGRIRDAFYHMEKTAAPSDKSPKTVTEDNLDNRIKVAILGHPYNTEDSFVNMNLLEKLSHLGIRTLSGSDISMAEMQMQLEGLIKRPYWLFYKENYSKASVLTERHEVDGIIYVSSFCCGTDSVTIEMIRNRINDIPMLVLKLDEHTGEAGFNTRIEAFAELLERRKYHADNLSTVRRQPYLRQTALSGNRDRVCYSAKEQPERYGTGCGEVT